MAIEMLSYSQLGAAHPRRPGRWLGLCACHVRRRTMARWSCLPVHLPITTRPPPRSRRAFEALQRGPAKVEALATCQRADFERERERLDRLMVDLLRATLDAQSAKEGVARLDGELRTLRWRRVVRSRLQRPHESPAGEAAGSGTERDRLLPNLLPNPVGRSGKETDEER
jgi:hypothetical protein